MAKSKLNPKVEFELYISLNESEARALEAIVGYGVDDFLKVFYTRMGEAYLKPHEGGLRSLFQAVKDDVIRQLRAVDKARAALESDETVRS